MTEHFEALISMLESCSLHVGDPEQAMAAAELRRLHDEAASLRDQNTELDRKLAEQERVMKQASMTDRELLQQALLCLEGWENTLDEDCGEPDCDECKPFRRSRDVIKALRERLAQPIIFSEIKEDKTQPDTKVNSEVIPEQISERCPNCASLEAQNTELDKKLAEREQEPIDSAEKAASYLDARLWEFIDMAAAWPEATPDPSTWDHVMVYAPKQPEQEPAAWKVEVDIANYQGQSEYRTVLAFRPDPRVTGGYIVNEVRSATPLYITPPRREWVGLTDEEKSDLWCESTGRDGVNEDTHVFADAIEAKLKEKNNG